MLGNPDIDSSQVPIRVACQFLVGRLVFPCRVYSTLRRTTSTSADGDRYIPSLSRRRVPDHRRFSQADAEILSRVARKTLRKCGRGHEYIIDHPRRDILVRRVRLLRARALVLNATLNCSEVISRRPCIADFRQSTPVATRRQQ
jgi:hypothetical protein